YHARRLSVLCFGQSQVSKLIEVIALNCGGSGADHDAWVPEVGTIMHAATRHDIHVREGPAGRIADPGGADARHDTIIQILDGSPADRDMLIQPEVLDVLEVVRVLEPVQLAVARKG